MGHFSATQTETRQKEQNRVVAPARGRGPITGLEETLDLLRLKGLGQVREPPVCYRRNGSSQIGRDLALFIEKAEEATKRARDELGTLRAHPVRMA
jgi:hypothetical protein